MSGLPIGWVLAPVGELLDFHGGGTPSKADPTMWDTGEIPWVSPKDMKTLRIIDSEDHVTEKALTKLTLAPAGAVLMVVRSGILCRTLPLGIGMRPVTVNQDMRVMLAKPGILPEYMLYQLISNETKILEACAKGGTTVASIEAPAFARYALHVAPTAEQVRIVAKLEVLLSDLDAGVAQLKAAQAKLGRYRKSLLKAAVDGSLTAEWRKSHTPTESGAQLLERIQTERRKRWEAKQLAKFQEQGKTPPKGWQDRYPQPVSPDTTDLPELPTGWVWASAEQLCEFITKGTTPPKGTDVGDKNIPFLRVTNLTDRGELDMSDKVFVSRSTHEGFLSRSIVYPSDVLMNIVGPPLGQVAIVPKDFDEWNINQAIAIFRAVPGVEPDFLSHVLLSTLAQIWLKARSKTTAGQTNLTLETCRALPIPLPSQAEQLAVIEAFGTVHREMAGQQETVERVLRSADAQRKNILKAAFSGRLVPQDPNDEPASVLLERIRAERAEQGSKAAKLERKAKT